MAQFDFPGAPNPGDVFTDPTSGASFTWNGYAWMGGAANSLGALIVSDTPPAAPANNSLWFESDTGMLFLRYNDGNSSQWVQVNALPNGAGYMPLRGVTDGSDAPAGQIGEVISGYNASPGITLASNVWANVTSITLTAGDWDVYGDVGFAVGTGGSTSVACGINPVSAAGVVATLNTARSQLFVVIPASTSQLLNLRPCRVNVTAPTPYYLIAQAVFPSGVTTAYGNIIARRAR